MRESSARPYRARGIVLAALLGDTTALPAEASSEERRRRRGTVLATLLGDAKGAGALLTAGTRSGILLLGEVIGAATGVKGPSYSTGVKPGRVRAKSCRMRLPAAPLGEVEWASAGE